VIPVPLGQGIAEMIEAVRDRIEVSGTTPTWEVTAGSFDRALEYARERFTEPVVLARSDRNRWWDRVTITVTTDPALAAAAPPLEQLKAPPLPVQRVGRDPFPEAKPDGADPADDPADDPGGMPFSLAAIFDHQEELRLARQRTGDRRH
jgi:hypothetical protein